jgi:tetratricopeptide (TPR) repeat protein
MTSFARLRGRDCISSPKAVPLQALFALTVLGLGAGCGLRTRSTIQREHLAQARPLVISGQTETATTTTALTVRVYVDDEHARQVGDFEARLRAQVERANRTLRAALDAELQIVEVRVGWSWFTGNPGLEAALAALEHQDPAADVDLVLGLVSPLALTSPDYHQLGLARQPGRHFVLRGMDDPEDLERLTQSADALPRTEVLAVYHARRKHRETAVLLHELAHTLGASHVEAQETLMSSAHSHRSTRFSMETVEVMRRGLRRRPPVGTTISRETNEDERARRFLDRGRPEDAIALLAPLVEAERASAVGHTLLCEALSQDPAATSRSRAVCSKAAEFAPGSPLPPLALARAALLAHDRESAQHHADAALARMLGTSGLSPHGAALASIYRALFDLVGAEKAISASEASEARDHVAAWAHSTRERLEAEVLGDANTDAGRVFIRVLLAAEEQYSVGAYAECLRMLRTAPKRYLDSGAELSLECAALHRAGRLKDAVRVCRDGTKRHPASANLWLTLGRVHAARGNIQAALRALERGAAVASEGHEVFPLLIQLYRAAGRTEKADALDGLHRQRFGRGLPSG